ncbi:MAG: CDGSH iron-sulfur domain-containing protein [Planctomycetes bacterium]|nr:CDGSH iron-sulfur domain-containing protein [Planctomycetota bacterium]
MPDVVIKTRANGPLLVTGEFTLIDHLGQAFDLTGQENVALCRCSHSAKRPFCDGTHRQCGFLASETARPEPSAS